MEKKYELIKSDNMDLFRIKALRDFSNVKVGDIGGYVSSEITYLMKEIVGYIIMLKY